MLGLGLSLVVGRAGLAFAGIGFDGPLTVEETAPAGAPIADLRVVNVVDPAGWTFQLDDDDGGRFAVSGVELVVGAAPLAAGMRAIAVRAMKSGETDVSQLKSVEVTAASAWSVVGASILAAPAPAIPPGVAGSSITG